MVLNLLAGAVGGDFEEKFGLISVLLGDFIC